MNARLGNKKEKLNMIVWVSGLWEWSGAKNIGVFVTSLSNNKHEGKLHKQVDQSDGRILTQAAKEG